MLSYPDRAASEPIPISSVTAHGQELDQKLLNVVGILGETLSTAAGRGRFDPAPHQTPPLNNKKVTLPHRSTPAMGTGPFASWHVHPLQAGGLGTFQSAGLVPHLGSPKLELHPDYGDPKDMELRRQTAPPCTMGLMIALTNNSVSLSGL